MEALKTTIVPYGDGIYAIDQQKVRAFVIVGEQKALLIDTGAVETDMPAHIQAITQLPVEVILTHSDIDHIGNLHHFPAAYIHPNDLAAVRAHESSGDAVLQPLLEGDAFDLGGRTLKALFTPGHTPGSVCLLDEANKLLFSGDVVSCGPVFMFGAGRSMPEYLLALKRLKRMKDDGVFTSVYCCHSACPIPADTIDDLIACAEGILNHTIQGVPADRPLPPGAKARVGRYQTASILFE